MTITAPITCKWTPEKHGGKSCPYHDALARMNAASQSGDYLAYEQARNDSETWKSVDRSFSKKLKAFFTSKPAIVPAPEQPAAYILAGNTVTLPNGQTFRVFDDEDEKNKEMSAYFCTTCSEHFTDIQGDDIISYFTTCCDQKRMTDRGTGLAILKSSLWMLDPKQYETKELNHFTEYVPKTDWEKKALTQPNLYIHVGNHETGEWRMRDRLFNGELRHSFVDKGRTFFRKYSIKVTDVPSTITVHADTSSTHDKFYTPENKQITDRFHLYVNSYEAPGSLSLAVTPNHIQVTGQTIGYMKSSGNASYDDHNVKP